MGPAATLAAAAAGALEDLVAMEARWVAMPLRRAHVAAHGSETVRQLLVVRAVGADGCEGWGECPTLAAPGYTEEYTASAWEHLRAVLVPALAEGSCTAALVAGEVLDPAFPMASSGLEGALVDLGLRRSGVALSDVLGADTDRVRRCLVVGMPVSGDPGARRRQVLDEVATAVAAGASMVKLKVDPEGGVEHVAAVREAFGSLALAADANGSLAKHPDLVVALGGMGLTYLEQPVPPGHPDAAAVARFAEVPVALDESATSPGALAAALASGEGSIVNLKAARVGGLAVAVRCLEVARAAGAQVFVGGMLESALGRASAVALAAAVGAGDDGLPTDLGPSSQYFDPDLGGPVVTDDAGRLVVPRGTGIGVVPDAGLLDAVTIDRWSVPCR